MPLFIFACRISAICRAKSMRFALGDSSRPTILSVDRSTHVGVLGDMVVRMSAEMSAGLFQEWTSHPLL